MAADSYVRVGVLAHVLGFTPQAARDIIRRRRIEYIVPGGRHWRISVASIAAELGDGVAARCVEVEQTWRSA